MECGEKTHVLKRSVEVNRTTGELTTERIWQATFEAPYALACDVFDPRGLSHYSVPVTARSVADLHRILETRRGSPVVMHSVKPVG